MHNNTLPAGQICAKLTPPPANYPASVQIDRNKVWNDYSDGKSDLQSWSEGLGWLALGVLVVAATVASGGTALALFAVAGVAGATSAGLNVYDRVEHGNFQWNAETGLDILNVVGSLTIVGGTVIKPLTKGAYLIKVVGLTAEGSSAVIISAAYYQQIQQIQQMDIPDDQKKQYLNDLLHQALLTGGLFFAGHMLARIKVNPTNVDESINNSVVSKDLQKTIKASTALQQILAEHNYDPTNLTELWKEWKSVQGQTKYLTFESFAPNNGLEYIGSAANHHVQQGDIGIKPTSPFYNKWDGGGLHNWQNLQAQVAKDGYSITQNTVNPTTGVREVVIDRSFTITTKTGKTITTPVSTTKSVYPDNLTEAQIDKLGDNAFKEALANGKSSAAQPNDTVLDTAGHKFIATVKTPDGKSLRIEGFYTESVDAAGNTIKEISSHYPILNYP